MKLFSTILLLMIGAPQMQASITNGASIAFGGGEIQMGWSLPQAPETLLTTLPSGYSYITGLSNQTYENLYIGVELSFGSVGDGTGLFYDPNGAAGSYNPATNSGSTSGCSQGGWAANTVGSTPISTNCVGNYLINTNSPAPNNTGQYAPSTQGLNATGPNAGQTSSFSVLFAQPETNIALNFYTQGIATGFCDGSMPGDIAPYSSSTVTNSATVQAAESALGLTDAQLCAHSYGTLIQAFSANGTLIEQSFLHLTSKASHEWTSIVESQPVAYVTLLDTGVNDVNNGTNGSWNFVLGQINPSGAPEPGTMVLLGCGLIGIGVMSRRRKSS
jgi:hypothetical protein